MQVLAGVLRLLALSILSGGSTAVVFAAVTLVKAATASGVPVSEAASANAPIFIYWGKIVTGASLALLLSLVLSFFKDGTKGKLELAHSACALVCILTASVYAFAIVPPMEALLPEIKSVPSSYEQFHRLHEISRAVFGASIAFAYTALLLPIFKRPASPSLASAAKDDKQVVSKH